MRCARAYAIVVLVASSLSALSAPDTALSTGRQADPTAKVLSDIRASERRRIPLEVQLKVSDRYSAGDAVDVTIIITNLFETPLTMNSRMLVNHPRLQGEVSFRIMGPDGQLITIQRLITPLSIRDQDFVTLNKGESMQRDVDLTDLYGLNRKGIYKIQVSYHNEVDYVGEGKHAWKGIVWSEPAVIRLE